MKMRSAIGLAMMSGMMGGIPLTESRVSYKNDSVAYFPKRKKFKGWQRNLRKKP